MFSYKELQVISKNIKEYSGIKTILDKAFRGLILNEETHTYTLQGTPLTSTSKFISSFETKPFNAFNISYGVTRAQNKSVYQHHSILQERSKDFILTKEKVIVRYKLMAEQAIAMGNRVHYYSELYPFFIKPHCEQEEALLKWFKAYLGPNSKYVYICSELRIFDKNTMKAGTIDLVLFNKKSKKLVLVDWKSNQKSLVMSYKGQYLDDSMNQLEASPYNKYSMQLSDYKNMIESSTSFEVEDMFIVHLFNKPLNYMSKYKNKASYVLTKNILIKAKTRHYTVFKAIDLTEELKQSYIQHFNKKPAF